LQAAMTACRGYRDSIQRDEDDWRAGDTASIAVLVAVHCVLDKVAVLTEPAEGFAHIDRGQ
jgi:hypothetical protein